MIHYKQISIKSNKRSFDKALTKSKQMLALHQVITGGVVLSLKTKKLKQENGTNHASESQI